MPTTAPVPVHPRAPGEPVPDVRGLRLSACVLLRDADRSVEVVRQLAGGGADPGPRRAGAVADHVRDWADAVEAQHAAQDELLWPVLLGSVGRHLDLSELRDDHAALVPALARLRWAARLFGVAPGEETGTGLAVELAEVRDALAEHVVEELAAVLPLIERHVSVRDWRRVERTSARRTRWSVELPRARAVLTAHERRSLPLRDRLVLAATPLVAPRWRRQQRLVLGR